MEKTIIIDGRSINFKSSASFLLRYKNYFGQDALQDLSKLQKDFLKGDVNVETLYKIIWALAKTADDSIPEIVTWIDSFNTFPLLDIFKELEPLILETFNSTITLKNQ